MALTSRYVTKEPWIKSSFTTTTHLCTRHIRRSVFKIMKKERPHCFRQLCVYERPSCIVPKTMTEVWNAEEGAVTIRPKPVPEQSQPTEIQSETPSFPPDFESQANLEPEHVPKQVTFSSPKESRPASGLNATNTDGIWSSQFFKSTVPKPPLLSQDNVIQQITGPPDSSKASLDQGRLSGSCGRQWAF